MKLIERYWPVLLAISILAAIVSIIIIHANIRRDFDYSETDKAFVYLGDAKVPFQSTPYPDEFPSDPDEAPPLDGLMRKGFKIEYPTIVRIDDRNFYLDPESGYIGETGEPN